MLFIVLEPIRHSNHIIRKKAELLPQSSNKELGTSWAQVTILKTEFPANQFEDEGEIGDVICHFAVIS